MNEPLIREEDRKRLAHLFLNGIVNLDLLWGDNKKALAESWKKAQATSQALNDMKSISALHDLPPASQAYAKLFAYLGLTEGLGVSLIDITLLLLIANGSHMHYRRGGGVLHVSKLKDLHKLNLSYKLAFLDAHELGCISNIVNRNLRNTIAHLNFTVTNQGEIKDPDGSIINVEDSILTFWNGVREITAVFEDQGIFRFIEQKEGANP